MPTHLQLTDTQRRVLDLLQGDLPDGTRPFDVLARRAGLSVEEFLSAARGLLEGGYLRKFAALLNHYDAGFTANAMCVWKVRMEEADEAGRRIAQFPQVTHCYRRPVSKKWPYALFCMIHATNRAECERVAGRIAEEIKPLDYRIIYSTRELKKTSMRLSL